MLLQVFCYESLPVALLFFLIDISDCRIFFFKLALKTEVFSAEFFQFINLFIVLVAPSFIC